MNDKNFIKITIKYWEKKGKTLKYQYGNFFSEKFFQTIPLTFFNSKKKRTKLKSLRIEHTPITVTIITV